MDTTLCYILIGSNIALVLTYVAQQVKPTKRAPQKRTKKVAAP